MRAADVAITVCILAAAVVVNTETTIDEGPVELSSFAPKTTEEFKPLKGRISLAELRETSLTAALGQERMTTSMATKAKHDFVRLAASFKSDKLRSQSLATVRLAQKVLLGEGESAKEKAAAKAKGDGLDLIFRKLNELRDEIKNEQKEAFAVIKARRAECQRLIKDSNDIIASSSDTMYQNYKAVEEAKTKTLPNNRQLWDDSRALEDATHATLVGEQADRESMAALVRSEVDEKNKAIDVMVKAAFLVCERFPRYKETKECQEIKSQPDVDEPQRYETKPYEAAKEETVADHAEKLETGEENPWFTQWKATMEKDAAKVGKNDPEGLIKNPVTPEEEDDESTNSTEQSASVRMARKQFTKRLNSVELLDIDSEAQESERQTEFTASESKAFKELEVLTKTPGLNHHYMVPLNELSISLKSGDQKRSKSIVEILLQVLNEIREEVAVAKADFQIKMDEYYKKSMEYREIMQDCTDNQLNYRTIMEAARVMILEKMASSETERVSSNQALAARTANEDACWADEEAYGIQEAINLEDLENLIKLKSLLRGLYDKKMPKSCPKHNGVLCSSTDAGWCVFIHEKASQGNDQRCSCNVGFYGDACQFRMCPGLAQNLYPATGEGSDGVCSKRGVCDPVKGLCSCHPEFYHGPKNACDYKHAPPSKNGFIDNKCTDGRGQLDKIRGVCNCDTEYYGSGCQEKRCPNSNKVLYPMESANACNGHGACDIDTGLCSCSHPYYHEETDGSGSCNLERCQDNCSGRGTCNPLDGSCVCAPPDKYSGANDACRWTLCNRGDGCGPMANGWCNRNDGKCMCHMGYSGYKCDETMRCEAPQLKNDKMNWWTIWDKPGWLVCPKGQLMWKLQRSHCQALSCLESGGCAAACEGAEHVFQLRHCYHDLRWYTSFDKAGWAKCLDDYFVAGLFRSCESLYCLNMAKCCSLKEARQPGAICGSTIWNSDFDNGAVPVKVPENKFITGFRRSDGHQLKNIESASYCGFVRGY
jgi:hypothetical protein